MSKIRGNSFKLSKAILPGRNLAGHGDEPGICEHLTGLRASSLWMRSWWVKSGVQQCLLLAMPNPSTSSSPVQTEFCRNSHTGISAAMMRGLTFFKYWKQYKARKQILEKSCKGMYVLRALLRNASLCPSIQGCRFCLVGGSTSVSDCHRKIQVQKLVKWKLDLCRVLGRNFTVPCWKRWQAD